MPRKQLQNLTEPMIYILGALDSERCGVEIMRRVNNLSNSRVTIGPGTLYALLDRFSKEKIIRLSNVNDGRKYYIISEKGKELLIKELDRINVLVSDLLPIWGRTDNAEK